MPEPDFGPETAPEKPFGAPMPTRKPDEPAQEPPQPLQSAQPSNPFPNLHGAPASSQPPQAGIRSGSASVAPAAPPSNATTSDPPLRDGHILQTEDGEGEITPLAVMLRRLVRAGEGYRLTRFVLLRFTGLVYFIAFLVAAQQFIPLVGSDGLLPAEPMVLRAVEHHGSASAVFWKMPSFFWFHCSDTLIRAVTWSGVALSLVVLAGFANVPILLALWALYLSLLPIGQDFTGYGWDIQLLETGFLAIFLAPLFDPRPFPARAPSIVIITLYRWLIFRIMLGAGLIKLRGDEVWSFKELSALFYHYETQPVPNPLSRLLHFAPQWFHKAGVLWNHFVELVVPWFGFGPRVARHVAGFLMASFQVILILSGNLSFLNWLTIVPCLACFDDTFWRRLLPRRLVSLAEGSARANVTRSEAHTTAVLTFAMVVVCLSIGPVKNLLSPGQAMNTSFDRLHLVNTYGAFGTVDKERFEIILEGTDEAVPEMLSVWKEYPFKAKPGDPARRPAIITPYHYRLDWESWFPWSRPGLGRQRWMPHLIWKLLHNDPGALSLLGPNPFPDQPPTFIRASLYRYKFAPLGNSEGLWWTRERVGTFINPVSKEDAKLLAILKANGWVE